MSTYEPKNERDTPIEQQLDMNETGPKSDDILHSHGREPRVYNGDPVPLDEMTGEINLNRSEENRES